MQAGFFYFLQVGIEGSQTLTKCQKSGQGWPRK